MFEAFGRPVTSSQLIFRGEVVPMQLDMQALGFPLTEALRERVRRRMEFTLGARGEHIQRVTVRLSDINGPRGGKDMCCQIQVVLSQMHDVVIKDTQTDLYVAIDRAFSRAGRSVARQLNRQITKQRAPIPVDSTQLEYS